MKKTYMNTDIEQYKEYLLNCYKEEVERLENMKKLRAERLERKQKRHKRTIAIIRGK